MMPSGTQPCQGGPSPELVALVHAQRGHLSVRQRVAGADALLRRMRKSRSEYRTARWARAAIALASAAAIAVGGGVWSRVLDRGAMGRLSYVVDGACVARGSLIDVNEASEARVRFSDGSDVLLGGGSHVSLRQIDSFGARVSLFNGSAYVDVVHRAGAHWYFDAGPFLIMVTGTAFHLGWDAAKEELDVRMDRGSVEVTGPLSDSALALRSGQHLVVHVRERETLIRERDEDAARRSPDSDRMEASVETTDEASASPSGAVPSASPPSGVRTRAAVDGAQQDRRHGLSKLDWPRLLASGDFESILGQADRMGVDGCLTTANSADLSALADAARYARRDELARSALLAQRHRFAAGRAACDAAYLLGKLEETDQNPDAALGWYDRYMREDAKGPYASDALGRKMIVTQQLYGDAQARSVATEYLGRFPEGAYGSRARALTREP